MESLTDRQVTVLGCGNMGSALVRTLADSGYEVTAWNRTHGRAEALTSEHVVAMRSARDAASASPTILACVSVYSVLQQVLESIGDISGKTLIHLTTGSPREAEAMASWAAAHQVGYLDGVITVYPRQIGNRDAQIMISGPTDLWLAHQASLHTIAGAARHVSESPSLANVLDVGLVGAFYIAALTAFMEATAFALDCGVTPEAMLATAPPVINLLQGAAEEAIEHVSTGRFCNHDASVSVFGEAARAMAAEVRSSGHSAQLLGKAAQIITEAERQGLGELSLGSVTKVLAP
jgi:3-hydroxyisobutyrate dehydrogenase-like beta-hydroxyacid dehydrogenase